MRILARLTCVFVPHSLGTLGGSAGGGGGGADGGVGVGDGESGGGGEGGGGSGSGGGGGSAGGGGGSVGDLEFAVDDRFDTDAGICDDFAVSVSGLA